MGFIKKLFGSQNKTISLLEANSMLKRTNELANIANKTTDRDEFYNSLNEIKDILRELSKYEGKLPFIGSPSSDLKNLEGMEQSQIELLEKRIKEKLEKDESSTYLINANSLDALFAEAGRTIIEKDKASIGMLQRWFKIGFNRAVRIMEQLEDSGVVEREAGTSPREILMTMEEFERYLKDCIWYQPNKKESEEEVSIDVELILNKNFDDMEGHQFEYFCAELLKKNGFTNVEVTQGSGDHGIDILAEKEGITYAIQCKCYSSNIGNAAVQQAYTGKGFYYKDIAVVLTNRYFTPQAIEEAKALGVKLWDRDKLEEMVGRE